MKNLLAAAAVLLAVAAGAYAYSCCPSGACCPGPCCESVKK